MKTIIEFVRELMDEYCIDEKYLEKALTSQSKSKPNNERLEFLGNAILNMHLAKSVYELQGELEPKVMTLICNNARSNENLNRIGRLNGLDAYIITGPSTQGRVEDDMVSTAFEALIGMIFEKSGLDAATRFIDEFITMEEENIERYRKKDAISRLKEYLDIHNEHFVEMITTSIIVNGIPSFKHVITIDDKKAEGSGENKKAARMGASDKMVEILRI